MTILETTLRMVAGLVYLALAVHGITLLRSCPTLLSAIAMVIAAGALAAVGGNLVFEALP